MPPEPSPGTMSSPTAHAEAVPGTAVITLACCTVVPVVAFPRREPSIAAGHAPERPAGRLTVSQSKVSGGRIQSKIPTCRARRGRALRTMRRCRPAPLGGWRAAHDLPPGERAGMTDLSLFHSAATLATASSHGCPAHMTYLEAGVVG